MDNEDRQQCSLFLGDLSIFCDERDIEEAFAQFGEIIEVRIQRSRETCRPLSYGFVEFAEPECAEAALISMNNYVLKGRPLRLLKHISCTLVAFKRRPCCCFLLLLSLAQNWVGSKPQEPYKDWFRALRLRRNSVRSLCGSRRGLDYLGEVTARAVPELRSRL